MIEQVICWFIWSGLV